MGQQSGALYVRVGDTWHPVLNLASARLIAAMPENPQPVRESDLARTKRGPLLGIPGAPQLLGEPLPAAESAWTICDTDNTGATTVVVGAGEGSSVGRLGTDHLLVTPASGSPAYLLYNGQRAVVDLADTALVRVHVPALQIITEIGCTRFVCRHTWGAELYMHLARVLGFGTPATSSNNPTKHRRSFIGQRSCGRGVRIGSVK
ncbi:type VII secretion protein EccB [Mycobacterium sp. 1245805.9]|uniref:type VII secretion protein EccB n=1 Tax=Mycobacterium sp. 1245805.9 TaxID=1856862 RepID=UPI0007FB9657|nr:type VII secretion protein EccB [Mycobacterium sp. 1245805.9]OBI82698.1 hypothetical protein A9X00_07050 [Mycobacterium sp. 1245805.9]